MTTIIKLSTLGLGCLTSMSILNAKTIFSKQSNQQNEKPNIVLIMVDDMGYGDFGCYGNTEIKTPNIDRLSKMGMKFTDFHSNGAVSSPTRCSLMTGCYQQRNGIEGVITAARHRDCGLNPEVTTIADLLQKNGYDTAMYGKWHLGYAKRFNPVNYGFDSFVGYVSGNVDYFTHFDQAGYADWWHGDTLTKEDGYTTTLITDYAEKYLKKKHNKPFFLYVPFEACHYPWQGPKDVAIRHSVNGKYVRSSGRKDIRVAYKEMEEYLDDCVGRLMNTINECNLNKNTLILLFSDNGGSTNSCNYPLSGHKDMILEGGHRVPAMFVWPGKIIPNQVSDQLVLTMDILPTVCDVTNSTYNKKDFDGISFLPTLISGKNMPNRYVFWRNDRTSCARQGCWKLMVNRKTNEKILINLDTDLQEKHNLSNQQPKITKKLLKALKKWESSFSNINQFTTYGG